MSLLCPQRPNHPALSGPGAFTAEKISSSPRLEQYASLVIQVAESLPIPLMLGFKMILSLGIPMISLWLIIYTESISGWY